MEEDADGAIVEVRGFSCRKGKVFAEGPVAMGDVVFADIAGTGVDVVASRDMPTNAN